MGITAFLVEYITEFIASVGYLGIFFLMIMESMVMPIPSEAVMPFAGFLIAEGKFTFPGAILTSTLGTLVGSYVSYLIGLYGGHKFIRKYGKYFLLNEDHLKETEEFFARKGEITIFVSRLIPVVRHLISIPAGIGKMNIVKFFIYTLIGGCLWNSFLLFLGYYLRQNWEQILNYSEILDIIILILLAGLIGYIVYKLIVKRKKQS